MHQSTAAPLRQGRNCTLLYRFPIRRSVKTLRYRDGETKSPNGKEDGSRQSTTVLRRPSVPETKPIGCRPKSTARSPTHIRVAEGADRPHKREAWIAGQLNCRSIRRLSHRLRRPAKCHRDGREPATRPNLPRSPRRRGRRCRCYWVCRTEWCILPRKLIPKQRLKLSAISELLLPA